MAINDFTIHLIILKWLRIQKCRQKRKTMGEKVNKKETVNKIVFIHFNYLIDLLKYFTLLHLHHTILLFEYMNFLKMIHEKEFFIMKA